MSAMRPLLMLWAAPAVALVTLSPAMSQTSALKNHNSDAPIDVGADRAEVQGRADRAILSGNVFVRQAELTLTAARMTLLYTDERGIQVRRVDASGGVIIRSPSETARGNFAIYDLGERIITLIGGVTLTRGESHVSGGRLVLDLDSGRAVMDGGAPAGPSRPGMSSQSGRVTGTFTVPQRKN